MKSDQELDDPIKIMDTLIKRREQERAKAILEFKEGEGDLKFEQVFSLGYDYVEIAKGVLVKIERKVSETYFILRCKMADLAELLLHIHSDYDEEFELLKGLLFDKKGNIRIRKDTKYMYRKNTKHNLVSFGESEMLIHCRKS